MDKIIILFAIAIGTVGLVLAGIYFSASTIFVSNEGDLAQSASSSPLATEPAIFFAAGGVVPHHDLAQSIGRDFFDYVSKKGWPETIVLLSPDHFNAASTLGQSFIGLATTTEEFLGLKIDRALSAGLAAKVKVVPGDSFVSSDHGITALLPLIREFLPQTRILPILMPSTLVKAQLAEFVSALDFLLPEEAMVVASVDFSHYLPQSASAFHDAKSVSALINFRENDFDNLEVDCWQCLYTARAFAKIRQKESPYVIGRQNSADFLKADDLEETTSYFSAVFERGMIVENGPAAGLEEFSAKTILFVGDIMLDRYVEYLMKKNSPAYPFQKISQFLKGIDVVFGNLEGPIMKNPAVLSDDSMKFNFSALAVQTLSAGHFNLLGLANNHLEDGGKTGLDETREFLEKDGLDFVGDPLKCTPDFAFQNDDLTILAFNLTYFLCGDKEIVQAIKSAKSLNPGKFLIVSLHWGEEYQTRSSDWQQNSAHQMIDAGADLIVGHHPHVVQNLESYKGKLIFYSLGNFVFDQYFSGETQQGLAVGLEIYPQKLVFRLFPVQSRLSQPFLMKFQDRKVFLEELAGRSGAELAGQIKDGIIEIKR